ncbi:hypothetical protein EYS14_05835 [Alteromonadaceae bacterium M269]|nr:hypothetical protein EYS14_05835 [Alteromonadaceae bacterium M269]
MSETKQVIIGGDIEKTLNGEFDFDLKQLFEQGWDITQTTKGVIVQSLLVIMAVVLVLVYSLISYIGIENIQSGGIELEPNTQFFVDIISTVVLAPLMTGVIMMGVNHSVGAPSKLGNLFQFVPQSLPIVLTSLLTGLVVQLGLVLFILPGLYLMIATSFALPLVVEKKMTPLRAIYASIKAVNHNAPKLILLYVGFVGLFFVGFITFGIALIWVAPLYYNIKGILYRDMFGITVTLTTDFKGNSKHESVFIA